MNERFETFTVLIAKISRNIRKIKNQEMAEYDLRSAHISCLLKEYQPTLNGSKWLFPSPAKEDDSPRDLHTVYSKMQKALERAECKRVRFHDLRHTFATMALEHGMDVKTLSATIGHTSSASTVNIKNPHTIMKHIKAV